MSCGFTEKSDFYGGGGGGGGGGHEKTIYRGNCLKREAWSVCKFKGGGLAKKEVDGVFEGGGGGGYPNAYYGNIFLVC